MCRSQKAPPTEPESDTNPKKCKAFALCGSATRKCRPEAQTHRKHPHLDGFSIAGDAKDLAGRQAQADLDIRPPVVATPVVLADVTYLWRG